MNQPSHDEDLGPFVGMIGVIGGIVVAAAIRGIAHLIEQLFR